MELPIIYNLNALNSSGQPVNFQAINTDGRQILPFFNVKITDEGERNYRLHHDDLVLFLHYYLRLSSDARAASQDEILSNYASGPRPPTFSPLPSPMKLDFMDESGDSIDILSDDAGDMAIRAINMQHIDQRHATGLSREISNGNNLISADVGAFITVNSDNTGQYIVNINIVATPNNVELNSGGAGIIDINAASPNNVEPVIDSSGPTVTYTSPEPSSYAPSSYTAPTKPSSSGICKLVKVFKVIKAFGGIFSPSRLRKSKVREEKLAQQDEVPSSSAIPQVQKPEVTKTVENEKASSIPSEHAVLDEKAASGSASGSHSTASKALEEAAYLALNNHLPGASDQSVCDSKVTQLPQVGEEGIVQTIDKVVDDKTA